MKHHPMLNSRGEPWTEEELAFGKRFLARLEQARELRLVDPVVETVTELPEDCAIPDDSSQHMSDSNSRPSQGETLCGETEAFLSEQLRMSGLNPTQLWLMVVTAAGAALYQPDRPRDEAAAEQMMLDLLGGSPWYLIGQLQKVEPNEKTAPSTRRQSWN